MEPRRGVGTIPKAKFLMIRFLTKLSLLCCCCEGFTAIGRTGFGSPTFFLGINGDTDPGDPDAFRVFSLAGVEDNVVAEAEAASIALPTISTGPVTADESTRTLGLTKKAAGAQPSFFWYLKKKSHS